MNLLVTAILLLQDKSAEETFKRIQEKILTAKSLSVTFNASGGKDAGTPFMSGSIQMKGGDKWRLEFDFKDKDNPAHFLQVSNGAQVRSNTNGWFSEDEPTPRDANRENAVYLTHGGYLQTLSVVFALGDSSDAPKSLSLQKSFVAADFQTEASEEGLSVLSYSVSFVLEKKPPLEKSKIRLYYDSKTLQPAKRTVQMRGEEEIFTESYREWSIGNDIPEERFKLPEKKK